MSVNIQYHKHTQTHNVLCTHQFTKTSTNLGMVMDTHTCILLDAIIGYKYTHVYVGVSV